MSGLSIARAETIHLDDHRVSAPYVDAGSLDLWSVSSKHLSISSRPLNIRGIGIDREFRWTGKPTLVTGRIR